MPPSARQRTRQAALRQILSSKLIRHGVDRTHNPCLIGRAAQLHRIPRHVATPMIIDVGLRTGEEYQYVFKGARSAPGRLATAPG